MALIPFTPTNGKTPCGRILRLRSPRFNHAWRGPAEVSPADPEQRARGREMDALRQLSAMAVHPARVAGRTIEVC